MEVSKNPDDLTLKEVVLGIKKIYKYLLSRYKVVLLAGAVGIILGFFYAKFKKDIYVATCTFVLEEDHGGGLGQYSGLASIAGIDVGGGGGLFQSENIMELYKSRKMIEKTLLTNVDSAGRKELLIDRFIRVNKLRKAWAENKKLAEVKFNAPPEKFDRLQDSVVSAFVESINEGMLAISKGDKKAGIIKVEVKAKDEFFAKAFNDGIVKNVSDFYIQTKTQKTLGDISILQSQIDSVKNILNAAIANSANVYDATPDLNPNRQALRTSIQRSQFNAEASKAMLSELLKNQELAKITLRKETPLIQIIDDPVFPLKKERLGKLKGMIVGGFIFGFFSVLYLLTRMFLRKILS